MSSRFDDDASARRKPAAASRSTVSTRARDDRQVGLVAREHPTNDLGVDHLGRLAEPDGLVEVPRPLARAHAHHRLLGLRRVPAAPLVGQLLAHLVPQVLGVDEHAVHVEDDGFDRSGGGHEPDRTGIRAACRACRRRTPRVAARRAAGRAPRRTRRGQRPPRSRRAERPGRRPSPGSARPCPPGACRRPGSRDRGRAGRARNRRPRCRGGRGSCSRASSPARRPSCTCRGRCCGRSRRPGRPWIDAAKP